MSTSRVQRLIRPTNYMYPWVSGLSSYYRSILFSLLHYKILLRRFNSNKSRIGVTPCKIYFKPIKVRVQERGLCISCVGLHADDRRFDIQLRHHAA